MKLKERRCIINTMAKKGIDYSVRLKDITKDELEKLSLKGEALIITDLHLGAEFSNPREALSVLENVQFNTLVLGGDTFQSEEINEFTKEDEMVITKICELSKKSEVIFVAGNHDEDLPLEALKARLGIDQILPLWQDGQILVIHGHQEDGSPEDGSFLKWVANTGDIMFRLVKLKNLYDTLGNIIYQLPKKVRDNALKYGREKNSSIVISGHSHKVDFAEVEGITYLNPGGFASPHLGFVLVSDKDVVMYRIKTNS